MSCTPTEVSSSVIWRRWGIRASSFKRGGMPAPGTSAQTAAPFQCAVTCNTDSALGRAHIAWKRSQHLTSSLCGAGFVSGSAAANVRLPFLNGYVQGHSLICVTLPVLNGTVSSFLLKSLLYSQPAFWYYPLSHTPLSYPVGYPPSLSLPSATGWEKMDGQQQEDFWIEFQELWLKRGRHVSSFIYRQKGSEEDRAVAWALQWSRLCQAHALPVH